MIDRGLARKVPLLCACGALGLVVAVASRRTPGAEVATLAQSLADATGQVVAPEDIRWEPSDGAMHDATSGRNVLFLARARAESPRDLWRATVRVSPEGHPIDIVSVHDITGTELGDDTELVVSGMQAAFTTYAFGRAQSVTLLDLRGEGEQNLAEKPLDRVTSTITNIQQTGSGGGIARYDVTLDQPVKHVGLHLTESGLEISLADDAPESLRTARLDLRGELTTQAPGMAAQPARHLPTRLVFWAVDTVRAVPWIGPAPIAWLEEKTFGARALEQVRFRARGAAREGHRCCPGHEGGRGRGGALAAAADAPDLQERAAGRGRVDRAEDALAEAPAAGARREGSAQRVLQRIRAT